MNEIIHKIKGYLGYGLEIEYLRYFEIGVLAYRKILNMDEVNIFKIKNSRKNQFYFILRPLEDLTDEELDYIVKIEGFPSLNMRENTIKYINHYLMEEILTIGTIEYFLKNHIDYQGLIAQGLAIKKEQTNA